MTKPATTTTPFGGVMTTQPFTFPTTTPFATTTTAKPPTATTTPTPPTFAFTTPAAPTPTSFTFNSGPSSTTTTPALPTTTTPELIIDAVTATTPDQSELSERQMQAPMFRGAVLRDLYAFLLNPNAPGRPLPTPSPTASASASRFGAALLGKSSNKLDMTNAIDTLAFVDRAAVATATSLPAGWRVLDEPTLLSALDHMGEVSALPLAAMKALEKYLARKVATWSEDEAKSLSVQFLVCFGLELTPRLDVHHRIRSTKLTDEEMAVLTSPPYSHFVDQALLERYQKTSNPTTNPATNNSSTSNLLALPAPSIPMPAAHEQPPASPRAFSFALPDPPAAQAQATTSTLSAHAQLFKKVMSEAHTKPKEPAAQHNRAA